MKKPDLYLINGPLGAGKTTFLRHVLEDERFKTARVIENEFASTSIDTQALHDHEAEVQTIAGVCICCSTGEELIDALKDLARSDAPVIIEATGVANSLQLIEKLVLGDMLATYQLAHAVFVCDAAEIGPEQLDEYSDELRAADTVLITKLDLVDADQAVQLRAALTKLGARRVLEVAHGAVELDFLAEPSQIVQLYSEFSGELQAHDDGTSYTVLTPTYPIEPSDLKTAWSRLVESFGLRRLKGDVRDSTGGLWHVQATPAQLRVTQGDERQSQLVFIGGRAHELTTDRLREVLGHA